MKYLKILTAIFFTLVVVVAGLLILTVFQIPGYEFNIRVVQTGSMEPAIKTGSIVITRQAESYAINDVVTFQRKDSRLDAPVTHRIIDAYETDGIVYFTTKGDANNVQDLDEITAVEILGKVNYTVPFVGYVLNLARTPYGFVILIIIPTILIIWEEIQKVRNSLRKETSTNHE